MNNIIGPYRYNDELYYRNGDGEWFSMVHDSLQVSLEEALKRYKQREADKHGFVTGTGVASPVGTPESEPLSEFSEKFIKAMVFNAATRLD